MLWFRRLRPSQPLNEGLKLLFFDFNLTFIFKTPEVRLRSGTLVSEGRVEVRLRDSWGTICDDHWTLREANVVCRSLGFGSAAIAAKNAYFGRGIGQVNRSSAKKYLLLPQLKRKCLISRFGLE